MFYWATIILNKETFFNFHAAYRLVGSFWYFLVIFLLFAIRAAVIRSQGYKAADWQKKDGAAVSQRYSAAFKKHRKSTKLPWHHNIIVLSHFKKFQKSLGKK